MRPNLTRRYAWIALLAAWTVMFLGARGAFADPQEDQTVNRWLSEIDRSSEKGDFEAVQVVRARLADYAAAIGRYDLAARHYELLLAARPGRAERVRIFIRLGNVRMALQ